MPRDPGNFDVPGPIFRVVWNIPKHLRPAPGYKLTKEMSDRTYDIISFIGRYVKEKLGDALEPGGEYDVGATGQAAENFTVETKRTRGGRHEIIISEGSYKANFFIRTGSTGHGIPPPEANIAAWAMAKFESDDPDFIHGVMWKIADEGTAEWSKTRPPAGEWYFDYLKYVAKSSDMAELVERGTKDLTRAILHYAFRGEHLEPWLWRRKILG